MDIKGLLKEAREALKNKDYKTTLKLSKTILKEEKTNYMAIVLLGRAFQELGPVENAPKAFHKAAELNPSNPLAWQCLINYYEKCDTEGTKKKELTECYVSYLGIEKNEDLLFDTSKKLAQLTEYMEPFKICSVLYDTSSKCSESKKMDIIKIILTLIETPSVKTTDFLKLYETCIRDLCAESSITEHSYLNFINYLHNNNRYEEALQHSIQMSKLFPSNIFALSWICKIFVLKYMEEDVEILKYKESVEGYVMQLLGYDGVNEMGLVTKAIFSTLSDKVFEAKQLLEEVTTRNPALLYAWILLTEALIRLKLFDAASIALNKAKQSVPNIETNVNFRKIRCQEIIIGASSRETSEMEKAIEMYLREDLDCKKRCLPYITKSYINLECYAEADKCISELKDTNEPQAKVLKITLLRKRKMFEEAREVVDKCCYDTSDWWFEVGLLHYTMERHKESLEFFLKAAKSDPDNYLNFTYLGHVYNGLNQLDKSRRCYEMALQKNIRCSEAGSGLSRIYRKQKKWDINLALLTNVTRGTINNRNIWAWMQLGLTYLEQGDASKSVDCLRMVLRIDNRNIHCWDSLGDAYFAKGSFSSAEKCYKKAVELSEKSVYSLLRSAYIKKILGEYPEAYEEFEKVLSFDRKYVPALKGFAETCFGEALACFKQQRLGNARDYSQIAVNKLTAAVLQRSELSCVWKLLADCVFFVAKLPEKYSCLSVSRCLVQGGNGEWETFLEKEELFRLATKCYCKTISLNEKDSFVWHDLATCYLQHSNCIEDGVAKREKIAQARAAVQQATVLSPGSWQHWNLFGIVAMLSDPPNYALAQHCLIKAVTAERNSAVSWVNLGILYLLKDELGLANKAFAEGQRSDPNYVNSWIGQAIIAETLGHTEAMDLFRHSTQLGQHQQGGFGYGNSVCQVLLNDLCKEKPVVYAIRNMNAVSVACDSMNWYIEKNPEDACAWNTTGILRERMGYKRGAKEAYRNAFLLAPDRHRDKARVNYARLLYRTGDFKEAIKMFRDVNKATFSSGSGLALALLRDGNYEESYSAYEQALHWLTQEESSQSDLLVALASIAYRFQGPEVAKALLFQSIELKPPSPWSLYATFSLGLLHTDFSLVESVLRELYALESKPNRSDEDISEYTYRFSTLLSHMYLLLEKPREGLGEISKIVHNRPNEASAWLNLSYLLLGLKKGGGSLVAAAKCANAALVLRHTKMDILKVLEVSALASFMAKDFKRAIINAQRSIHHYPNVSSGWALLISFVLNTKDKVLPKNYCRDMYDYFVKIGSNDDLLIWAKKTLI